MKSISKSKLGRRQFVAGIGAAGIGITVLPRHVVGGAGFKAPSDRLNIACIGIGGKGNSDTKGLSLQGSENIYATCDIDDERGADIRNLFSKAKHFKDFRDMLDKEGDNIDAVSISTPDHTHAVAAIAAMKMGKHVRVQKPLARTVAEVRMMTDVAKESGVVTQMGNQGNAGDGTRVIREMIDAGLIGTPREVHYWTNRPIWPQAIKRPLEVFDIPAGVEWDLWLGPAKYRPYNPAYHPFAWRGWWDFGTGALGDIACHAMDAAFGALDLGSPSSIKADTTPLFRETAPASSRIEYLFPAKGSRPEIKVVWRDGNLTPPRPKGFPMTDEWPFNSSGQLIVGDEGNIVADIYGNEPVFFTEAGPQDPSLEEKYPRLESSFKEFIDACKGGPKPGSNIVDHAGPLTEMVLLGNLAVRTSEIIRWDASMGIVSNVDAANAYLKEEARTGWEI